MFGCKQIYVVFYDFACVSRLKMEQMWTLDDCFWMGID